MNTKGSVYACSDLHGQYELWQHIRDYCLPEDTIFFLGDAIDRGTDNLRTFSELLSDERVTFIKGNHENMIENYGKQFLKTKIETADISLWMLNGGENTLTSLCQMEKEKLDYMFKAIDNMPHKAIYTNKNKKRIHLSHAGETIGKKQEKIDYLWNRNHIFDTWDKKYDNDIVVHGHTPVQKILYDSNPQLLTEHFAKNPKIICYADNHKIDIDLGSFFSHTAVLLDLDTLTPIYFNKEGVIYNK